MLSVTDNTVITTHFESLPVIPQGSAIPNLMCRIEKKFHLPFKKTPDINHQLRRQRQATNETRTNDSRMNRRRQDLRISACEFNRHQQSSGLTLPVTHQRSAKTCILLRFDILEIHARFGREDVSQRRHNHNADIGIRQLCGFKQHGEEKLDEKSVGEIVDSELHFVAILRQCWRRGHDAGTADEDVETWRGELLECGFDGVEGGVVHFYEDDIGTWD